MFYITISHILSVHIIILHILYPTYYIYYFHKNTLLIHTDTLMLSVNNQHIPNINKKFASSTIQNLSQGKNSEVK